MKSAESERLHYNCLTMGDNEDQKRPELVRAVFRFKSVADLCLACVEMYALKRVCVK